MNGWLMRNVGPAWSPSPGNRLSVSVSRNTDHLNRQVSPRPCCDVPVSTVVVIVSPSIFDGGIELLQVVRPVQNDPAIAGERQLPGVASSGRTRLTVMAPRASRPLLDLLHDA